MYRSGNRAAIMKYHPDAADSWELVCFDPRPSDQRKVREDAPAPSYFL
jgi:hypothetical protein